MIKTTKWWLLPLCGLLAACSDGTGPDEERITAEDVAGFYQVCALRFVPTGALPTVDIRAAAFEATQPQPRLALDLSPQNFDLRFRPKGQFTDRELRGSYLLNRDRVELRFAGSEVPPASLLLPDRVGLGFQESPRTLSVASSAEYTTSRSEYARLAGISESGLAERIPGTLQARFTQNSCG